MRNMAVLALRMLAVIPLLSGLRLPRGEVMTEDVLRRRLLRLLLRDREREEEDDAEASSSDSNGRRGAAAVARL